MPISNPINTVSQGVDLTLSTVDPIAAPDVVRKFWFNYADRNLFLAIATNSVTDWIAIGSSPDWGDIDNKPNTFPSAWETLADKPSTFPVDVANILNKILVADGQVLTTDDNVIFED